MAENIYAQVQRDLGPQMVVIADQDNSMPPENEPQNDKPVPKTTRYTRASPEANSSQELERSRIPSLNSLSSEEGSAPEVPPFNPDSLFPLLEVPDTTTTATVSPEPTAAVATRQRDPDLLPEPIVINSPLPQLSPSPPPLPPLSTLPLQSPLSIARSRSPLPDYLVTSCLMSLREVANPEKAALPQLFKVEMDYIGKEINLHRNDFIMVLYKKPVLVVEALDSNNEKIYLSQNSKMTMCPIYNEIQQTKSMTARQLHASRVLPPVVKVREGFVDEKGTAVEPGTLIYFKTETRLKAISRKVRKAIIKGSTSKQERLHIPVNCPGVFSSSPDHLKMYLPEIIHHCQLPIRVLLEDGVYTSDAITLQAVNVQDVIVAQRYDSFTQTKLLLHLEIPVECPIAMAKVSLRNKVTEEHIYKAVYETLRRSQVSSVQRAPNLDENMYSFVYQPPPEEEGLGFYSTLEDWRKQASVPSDRPASATGPRSPATSRPLPSPRPEHSSGNTTTSNQHYQQLGEQDSSRSTYSQLLADQSQEKSHSPQQTTSPPPSPSKPNKQVLGEYATVLYSNHHREAPQEHKMKGSENSENSKQLLHSNSKPPTESENSAKLQQKTLPSPPSQSSQNGSTYKPVPYSRHYSPGAVFSKDGHIVINSGKNKDRSTATSKPRDVTTKPASNACTPNDTHTSRPDNNAGSEEHDEGSPLQRTAESVLSEDRQLQPIPSETPP